MVAVSLVGFAASAQAVGVTVEVTDAAEALLDSRLARRLITLELADVELPSVLGSSSPRGETAVKGVRRAEVVFVRLLADADVLSVELWAQGLLTGERRIRVAGTEEHQARRVALACAELARHVREARLAERQRVLHEYLFPSNTDAPSYSIAVSAGAALNTRAVWLPTVPSALIGPRAALWVRSKQGFGLELNGAYYHAADPRYLRFWSEVGLRPSWLFTLGSDVGLTFGPSAAVALLDVGARRTVVGATESQQTWSARVAVDAVVTYRLASWTSLTFGPELGLQLRDVQLQSSSEGSNHLRGLWLGVGLGAEWIL